MADIAILSGPAWNEQADIAGQRNAAVVCTVENTSGGRLFSVTVNVNINDATTGLKYTELMKTIRQWLPGDKAKFHLQFHANNLADTQKINTRYVIYEWSISAVPE